jgi:hypothetical protein
MPVYIPQVVHLEVNDLRAVEQYAHRCGLEKKDFSAALRQIIRQWELDQRIKQNRTGKNHPENQRTGTIIAT